MMARRTSAAIPWAIGLLPLEPSHRVADVGFGHGDSLAALLERVPQGRVAGIEMSETMLDVAAKRFKAEISSGRLALHHSADGRLSHVGEGQFDLAVSFNTIYITEDPAVLFADLRRLLVPGGRAAVTFPERSGFATFPPAQTEGFFLHELADLSRAMTEVGFEDVTVHDGPDIVMHPQSLVGVAVRAQ